MFVCMPPSVNKLTTALYYKENKRGKRGSGVGVHMHACVHSWGCVCVREKARRLITTLDPFYCCYYNLKVSAVERLYYT